MADSSTQPTHDPVSPWGRMVAWVEEFHWFHTTLGLIGNLAFLVGSLFFLFESLKVVGSWLFLVGATGMLLGSLGDVVAQRKGDG